MAWSQADRDSLAAAIASGVRRTRLGGHDTEFHDLAEMRALLAEMDRQLSSAPNYRVAATSKGT